MVWGNFLLWRVLWLLHYEGAALTLETSASETFYGGQFTLSTQLINWTDFLVTDSPPTQLHSFFRNLPLYFCKSLVSQQSLPGRDWRQCTILGGLGRTRGDKPSRRTLFSLTVAATFSFILLVNCWNVLEFHAIIHIKLKIYTLRLAWEKCRLSVMQYKREHLH